MKIKRMINEYLSIELINLSEQDEIEQEKNQ
jgi:hypothetical protein